MDDTFSGWPASALAFYAALEEDNSRSFWLDHKPTYDADVLAPMKALLDDLAPEFGESKIFRPNRDIRFSNDKSPYKTAIGATLKNGGYVQLSARGLGVGAGFHEMAPDQLDRYRVAVDTELRGEQLVKAIAEVESHGIAVSSHDRLKSAPRGYPKDHPRVDLLQNKNLTAWQQWPASSAWIHTSAAETHVVETLRNCRPLVAWLNDNVGPTALLRR